MNKKTATALSLSAVLGVSAAVGGGTYALFSDNETAEAQSIQAGTLDLELGDEAQTNALDIAPGRGDDLDGAEPGDAYTRFITLANTGTVDGLSTFSFSRTGTEGTCEEPEGKVELGGPEGSEGCDEGSELAEQLRVTVVRADGSTIVNNRTLAELTDGVRDVFSAARLDGKVGETVDSERLQLTFSVPTGTKNEVMSDSVAVVLNAVLDQTGEPTS